MRFAQLFLVVCLLGLAYTANENRLVGPNNADFEWSIDLRNSGNARIEVSPITFGDTDLTFEMKVYVHSLSGRQNLFYFGTGENRIYLDHTGGKFIVGIGESEKTINKVSVIAQKWITISMVVSRTGGTNAVSLYRSRWNSKNNPPSIDGESISVTGVNWPELLVATREGYFGYNPEQKKGLNGKMNLLRIWNHKRTVDQMKAAAINEFPLVQKNDIIAYFPVQEGSGPYISGFGDCEPIASHNGEWAHRQDEEADLDTSTTARCHCWGDPHHTDFRGVRHDYQPWGCYVYTRCKEWELRGYQYRSDTTNTNKASYNSGIMVIYDAYEPVGSERRKSFYFVNNPSVDFFIDGAKSNVKSGNWLEGITWSISGSTFRFTVPHLGYLVYDGSRTHSGFDLRLYNSCAGAQGAKGFCGGFGAGGESHPQHNRGQGDYHLGSGDCLDYQNTIYNPNGVFNNPDAPVADWPEPCEGVTDTNWVNTVRTTCESCAVDEVDVNACMQDACDIGTLDAIVDSCTESVRKCWEDKAAGLKDASVQCPLFCPNSCSQKGTCSAASGSPKCNCNAGFTGADCSLEVNYVDFKLNAGTSTSISPINLDSAPGDFSTVVSRDNSISNNGLGAEVAGSILFYPLRHSHGTTHDYSIVVIADAVATNAASSITVSWSFTKGGSSIVTRQGTSAATVAAFSQTGSKTFNFNTEAKRSNPPSMVFADIVLDGQATFTLSNAQGFTQTVVAGKSYSTSAIADLHKVNQNSFTISYNQVVGDSCGTKTDCKTCSADINCGWCRDTGVCAQGTAAGPNRGACKHWRFSFNSQTSRVLTSTFGFPTNPDDTEVWLSESAAADSNLLPVQVCVAVTQTAGISWDAWFLVENNDIGLGTSFKAHASAMYAAVNPGKETIGLAQYSGVGGINAAADAFNPIFIPATNNIDALTSATQFGSATAEGGQFVALKNLLFTNSPAWTVEPKKRRVVIVVARSAPDGSVDAADVRDYLINNDVIPIFMVTGNNADALYTTYSNYVESTLGFGIVDKLTSNWGSDISRAMNHAAGYVAMVVPKNAEGHIDVPVGGFPASSNVVHGLTPNLRACFTFEMEQGATVSNSFLVSRLVSPGFGDATVENVPTDKPTTTGPGRIDLIENYQDPRGFNGVVIPLSGCGYKDFRVSSRYVNGIDSGKGKLYQFNPNTDRPGAEINEGDAVTDQMMRVVYVPPTNGYSLDNSLPYTTINYDLDDQCVLSNEHNIQIFLRGNDHPPVVPNMEIEIDENTGNAAATQIDLTGQDANDDPFNIYIDAKPDNKNSETAKGFFLKDSQNNNIQNGKTKPVHSGNTGIGNAPPNHYAVAPVFYLPGVQFHGTDSFQYKAVEADGKISDVPGVVTITVLPVNDPPTGYISDPAYVDSQYQGNENLRLHATEDIVFNFTIVGTDVDTDGLALDITLPAGFRGAIFDSNPVSLTPGSASGSISTTTGTPIAVGGASPVTVTDVATGTGKRVSKMLFFVPPRNANSGEHCDLDGCDYPAFNTLDFTIRENTRTPHQKLALSNSPFLTFTKTEPFDVGSVPDPPVLPEEPIIISFNEDREATATLAEYTDEDTDLNDITTYIHCFPTADTFTIHTADGTQITDDTTVIETGPNHADRDQVIVRGVHNRHGDSAPWKIDDFCYVAKDIPSGNRPALFSNQRRVDVRIKPINDAPVPSCEGLSTPEDTPITFFLDSEVIDIDTDFSDLVFRVTAIPDSTTGILYHGETQNEINVGDVIEHVVYNPNGDLPTALPYVRFEPAGDWYTNALHAQGGKYDLGKGIATNALFSYSVTDKDAYLQSGDADYKVNTANCGTLEITVNPVNDPPYAEMVLNEGDEDTGIVITVSGWDKENDTISAVLDTGAPRGAFYQYADPATLFDGAQPNQRYPDVSSLTQITVPGGHLSDSQFRALFVPCEDCNSDQSGRVSQYKLSVADTTFSYFMQETATDVPGMTANDLLRSDLQHPHVKVNPINDRPEVWNEDFIMPSFLFPCWDVCDYREDLGEEYPLSHPPMTIYLGGGDIEEDLLRATILDVQCHAGAQFSNMFEPGYLEWDTTDGLARTGIFPPTSEDPALDPYKLFPTLKFQPAQDQNGERYCVIEYEVNDGQLDSLNTKTITLDLDPVNDAPRPWEKEDYVWTIEGEAKEFPVLAFDVEEQDFEAELVDCWSDRGKVYIVQPDGSHDEFVCGSEASPKLLPGNSETRAEDWKIFFDPDSENVGADGRILGDIYNKLTISMNDQSSENAVGIFTIKIGVFSLNDPPLLTLGDEVDEPLIETETDAGVGSEFVSICEGLTVKDIDIKSFRYNVKLELSSPSDNTYIEVPFPESSSRSFKYPASITETPAKIYQSMTPIEFEATEITLNTLLPLMKLKELDTEGTVLFKMTVNDTGKTGSCTPEDNSIPSGTCPLAATYINTVNVAPAANALGAGAVAAIGAAAVFFVVGAGAASWKKMRNPPTENYEPWLLEDVDVGVSNPLYKENGLSGNNPLYAET